MIDHYKTLNQVQGDDGLKAHGLCLNNDDYFIEIRQHPCLPDEGQDPFLY